MPSRRSVLAACAGSIGVYAAGCMSSSTGPLLRMEPTTESAQFERWIETWIQPIPPRQEPLVSAAVAGDAPTGIVPDYDLEDGDVFRYPGEGYYELSLAHIGTEIRTTHLFHLRRATEPSSGDHVDEEALSAADRRTIEAALPIAEDDETHVNDEGFEYQAATVRVLDEEQRNESVLTTLDRGTVEFEGRRYRIAVDDEPRDDTIYRYETTYLGEDRDAAVAEFRDRWEFELDGLDESERDVVEAAIDDEYRADDEGDEAIESLVDRITEHKPYRGSAEGGHWLARYRDTSYVLFYT